MDGNKIEKLINFINNTTLGIIRKCKQSYKWISFLAT